MAMLARYFLLGGIGFGLGLFLSWNFHENLNLSEPVSVALTVIILFFFNFFMARSFIFKDRDNLLKQAAKFIAISLTMRGAEYILFLILFYVFGIYYLVSYMTAIAVIYLPKYFLYKTVVFNAKRLG